MKSFNNCYVIGKRKKAKNVISQTAAKDGLFTNIISRNQKRKNKIIEIMFVQMYNREFEIILSTVLKTVQES